MDSLVVKDIAKSYGKFEVLKKVSFKVGEGEIFGLLGPNGAGKSTLIRILLGFESANAGSFSYFTKGRPLWRWEIQSKVAIVPQQLCFYRNFSVQKNLEMMGTLYGLSGKDLHDRVEVLLKRWNLARFRNRRAGKLSGGFKRMLNIACGMINDPLIVFLDEPTVGLDPRARKGFWKKILQLRMLGKTIILTTHYMDEAEFLCNRIGIVVGGVIAKEFEVPKLKKNRRRVEDVFIKLVEEKGIKREDI